MSAYWHARRHPVRSHAARDSGGTRLALLLGMLQHYLAATIFG